MNILIEFLVVFKEYLIEVLPFLIIGFLLSGLIHEFIPAKLVERHLGGKGINLFFILPLPVQFFLSAA